MSIEEVWVLNPNPWPNNIEAQRIGGNMKATEIADFLAFLGQNLSPLYLLKSRQYAVENDPLVNFREVDEVCEILCVHDLPPDGNRQAIRMVVHKLHRLIMLQKHNCSQANEPMQDTLRDLWVYAALSCVIAGMPLIKKEGEL